MTMPGAIVAARILAASHDHGPSLSDYGDEQELRSFCVAFQPDNKIHLFPPSTQTAYFLRDTVEKNWPLESADHGTDCYTLNLEGTPFLMYSRREHALLIKYICCLMLERFKAHGWELVACTDLSNKTDLTAWYFAREPITDDGTILRSPTDGNSSLVCLSLSAKRKLQLINASSTLQKVLHELVLENYEPGMEQDAHYGRDYQIKLKGSPWDTENRAEIAAACKLVLAAFREFGNRGYHLYGLVNLKDTADSLFFEYDPTQTLESDQYMMMALDEENILRLINATPKVVQVVNMAIDQFWLYGLEAEGRIDSAARGRSPKKAFVQQNDGTVCWEFILKGSPWQVPSAKIGRARQFVTHILDALLAHGWTVVTGLDISRALNKKSALLFQACPPVRGIRHACLSPLGKQRYQLINAPASLRHLVRVEFGDVIAHEKITEDKSVYEITFSGAPWWVTDPEQEQSRYVYVRKRMGRLLQTLMDAGWCVIASADISRQIREDNVESEGIHSWFVIHCGYDVENAENGVAIKVTANSVLQVGGRIGTARPNSPCCVRRGHRKSVSAASSPTSLSPVRTRRTASFRPPKRNVSPSGRLSLFSGSTRRSKSGYEFN